MDKIMKIKLTLVLIYLGLAITLFYDHHASLSIAIFKYNTMQFMVAVLSLGVILSSSIYNFAFYFYIRKKQYLYYALSQFAILSLLIQIENLFINPFNEYYNFTRDVFLLDISQILIIIFSMLFIEKFLNLYSIKRLSRLIHIVISIALVDLVFTLIFHHAIIIKFIPSFIWILVVLSEAHRLIKKKDIPFYFIIVGWSTVLLVSIFEFLGISAITFPYLHLAFAIESMLLSFAVSYKFNLIEEEKKVQQTLLLQQSRLASMGEMISIIAHQWRQPLNFLSFALMHIKRGCKNDEEALLTIKDASEQLQYMSQTIENFRNFYNPSKNKAEFSIQKSCENTLKIVSPTLLPSKIDMKLDIKEDFKFFANSNEFEQVILNIINNARDILVERKVENPKIEITINKPQIAITDNGGGVAKENIDKIFEPYFTTKKNSDGIGLYISKTIIENEMKGKLELITDSNGSSFVITF